MRLVLILSIFLLVAPVGFSKTVYVPDDYAGIQWAINFSQNGDTIIVRPGTYMEHIDFLGKALVVRSEKGANCTVIDATHSYLKSAVAFRNGEGPGSIIEGFTLTNGTGYEGLGGGVYCQNASPMILNNIIQGNRGKIYSNKGAGGGIFCENASPQIIGNVIINNTGVDIGGGIMCMGNKSSPSIFNNIISGNKADRKGGGIAVSGESNMTIVNNIIAGNAALTSGNVSRGGGILCNNATATISNNTFFNNRAKQGGGISMRTLANVVVTDSILWKNNATEGPQICMITGTGYSTLTISHSDVDGGLVSVYVESNCNLNWGSGMIEADPLFSSGPRGFLYLGQVAAGQPANSPCVDAGSDLSGNLGMDIYWTRTDGVPDSGTVDMGFHYGDLDFTFPALQTDTYSMQESTGGDAELLLLTGPVNANRNYILLGSVTGTDPGFPLPGGKISLPLTWDIFTDVVIASINTPVFSNFMGTLDGTGSMMATFDTLGPIAGAQGLTFHFAYALNAPWDFASNPVGIEILP